MLRQTNKRIDIVSGTATPSPFEPFVVFAQEGVWLKEKSVVRSGHVAANSVSSGPYLSDSSEMVVGQQVKFKDPASRLYGDSILLRDKSEVYDVYYNEIDGDGTVKGTRHTPLTLPIISTLPAIPIFTPGTQDITVDEKDSLTLNAGNYDTLRARKKATITFTGGVYTFSSWNIGEEVTLEFTASTEIRIAGKLDTDKKTTLGPKAGVNGLTAKDIRIIVMGQNGKAGQKEDKDNEQKGKDKDKDKNNKNIHATPKAAEFGEQNTINATIYAPNGTLWLRQKTDATGSFIARWVVIGEQVELTLSTTILPTATPTRTPEPTDPPKATKTEKPTRTPEPTDTPKATKTEKPTRTPEPTDPLKATSTFTPTRTGTTLGSGNNIVHLVAFYLQATSTNTPSATFTTTSGTPTPTVTSNQSSVTPSSAPTATSVATATLTNTPISTATSASSPTPTSTSNATQTSTATTTFAGSATATQTPTPTATLSASTTLTATVTATTAITTTLTASPTITATTAITTTLTASPTITGAVSLTPTATPLSGVITTTITYTYDELYRLTDAVYSDGKEFHYEYDAVGNILTKAVKLNGITTTTTYTYDDANRLQTVNGVAQQFDANGNLINDGTKTYAYDAANRLKSITQGTNVSTYNYNGLGDRVSQTNNGVMANYSLDLNAGLTQVLSDGTNTYLYGLGRIGEQQANGFAYHLGDALGSVRQLTDSNGVVQLTRSYEPYGETLSSVGSGNSVYQFTGEMKDGGSGLTFLRARYYNNDGRFLSRDEWQGDSQSPMSYNGWGYVYGNVINLTDPRGNVPQTDPSGTASAQCGDPGYRYCVLSNGAYLDIDHFGTGVGEYHAIMTHIKNNLTSSSTLYPYEANLPGTGLAVHLEYRIENLNTLISKDAKNNTKDMLDKIALGIFLDEQITFEFAQSYDPRIWQRNLVAVGMLESLDLSQWPKLDQLQLQLSESSSSFSNEDLPSDYLGFVAAMKGKNIIWVANQLGGGYPSKFKPQVETGTTLQIVLCSGSMGKICLGARNNSTDLKVQNRSIDKSLWYQLFRAMSPMGVNFLCDEAENALSFTYMEYPSSLAVEFIPSGDYWRSVRKTIVKAK